MQRVLNEPVDEELFKIDPSKAKSVCDVAVETAAYEYSQENRREEMRDSAASGPPGFWF